MACSLEDEDDDSLSVTPGMVSVVCLIFSAVLSADGGHYVQFLNNQNHISIYST